MKFIYLVFASTLLWFSAGAQMMPRNEARQQERQVKHADYVKYMDSVIMTRNYRFSPNSYQQQPAGPMRFTYNPDNELVMYKTYMDINIPYVAGFTPPYYLTSLSIVTSDVENYTAVQTKDGWRITFGSFLLTENKYSFTLDVFAVSREATLSVASDVYNTVTYNGTIQGTY